MRDRHLPFPASTYVQNMGLCLTICKLHLVQHCPMPSISSAIHTWLTTSKKSAQVVFGLNVQNFHWHVLPMPISVSDTQGPFTLRDTQEPIAPDTAITETEITLYVTGLQSNRITAH